MNQFLLFSFSVFFFLAGSAYSEDREHIIYRDVCYNSDNYFHDLGCFTNSPPFDAQVFTLPKHPNDIPLKFTLYKSVDEGQTVDPSNYDAITFFDNSLPTILVTHGWSGRGESWWLQDIRPEIFQKIPDLNFIVLDWAVGAGDVFYPQSAANSRVIGAELGYFLKFLVDEKSANASSIHVIGHSLGAQVAGYAGKWFQEKNGGTKIGRITAMDPARPCFERIDSQLRISKSDADFVDAIHTNAHPIFALGFGIPEPVGHIDFYPHGGHFMPGCGLPLRGFVAVVPGADDAKLFDSEIDGLMNRVACSHMIVKHYMINSINNCTFQGFAAASLNALDIPEYDDSCKEDDSCPVLGLGAIDYMDQLDLSKDNIFWVDVTPNEPYCAK